jgi:hypothetical protein
MTNTVHTVTVESAPEAHVCSRGKARFLSIAQQYMPFEHSFRRVNP